MLSSLIQVKDLNERMRCRKMPIVEIFKTLGHLRDFKAIIEIIMWTLNNGPHNNNVSHSSTASWRKNELAEKNNNNQLNYLLF